MKQLLSLLLLVTLSLSKGLDVMAQVYIKLPDGLVNEHRLKAYVDSAITANKTNIANPVDPVPPVVTLKPCDRGPKIQNIYDITSTSLAVQFDGQNVFGIDFKVYNSINQLVSSGSIKPTSNVLSIPYTIQSSGNYKLVLDGNTCSGYSEKTFEIKKSESVIIPPVQVAPNGNYELFLNTTGYGFDPNDYTGINKDWRERIEAFRYSWGYGITGVRILVRWYEWEPKIGEYKVNALRSAAKYCQDRGLKFSVYFWPWRLENDGFVINNELVRGNHGSRHILEDRLVMGSLVSDYTNQLLFNTARRIGEVMSEFSNSYYASVGTATAEEFINPWIQRPYEINPKTENYEHKEQPEIGGFEQISQNKFKAYLESKGRSYAWPEVIEWGTGVALNMNGENGKDFARFISLSLKNYSDNFISGIKEGSKNKVLTAYTYPDAGSQQNAYHLNANFADQAANADILYGTDGNTAWDIDRKLVCNALNKGFGKISMIEYDPEDLGDGNGRPSYCSGLIRFDIAEREFTKAYEAGANVICLSMAMCPAEIQGLEPLIKRLSKKYIGQPYQSPNWPITSFDIAPAYFGGMDMYAPHYTDSNWLFGSSINFWGEIQP